ncbi:18872_t:CDS:2 [Funneliformis geosporum]|uniref:Branchpoint-bridging protein n=1 Tax=Funneliformis geosporum TaxID=1117311 RepID=A0A9W4WUE3_9GLOM|nr:18872_t:CDS:2 [Funneliformis geosporum]CAI2186642.1 14407_t:CDS:2 [Funneliformis geosporum]
MYKPSITGTNNIPLGKRRLGGSNEEAEEKEIKVESNVGHSLKRASEEHDQQTDGVAEGRRRKRRSRWSGEETKVDIGVPTAITYNMSKEQLDTYLLHMRLEEIGRKLRLGDYVPPERERSASPEPVYDSQGKRVNTREYRYRKKLEDERHKLIEEAVRRNPEFKPPADYKKPTKVQDKVYIPAKEFPEINFIGLLIGPRGNTLKKMESESGAKISIRGRGSVKEGKSRTDAAANANQEEDLHCLVTADAEEKVAKAVKMINKIIETSASVPEGQNELKRQQLRELAALNGTLRDDENQICTNCGATGHRKYECSETQNFTINLTCRICGGHGHTPRDCMERNNPEALLQAKQRDQKLDSEYLSLMAELGENVETSRTNEPGAKVGHYGPSGGSKPPWQSHSIAGSATAPPWAPKPSMTAPNVHAGTSALPPWQQQNIPPPPGLGSAPPPPGLSTSTPWSTVKSSYPPPPPPGASLYPSTPNVSMYPPPVAASSYSYATYNNPNYGVYGTTYSTAAAAAGYPPPPPSTARWVIIL